MCGIDSFSPKHSRSVRHKHRSCSLVTIRMTDVEGTQVINSGGKRGVYYEPRSASGRETHGDFGVVWLPKKSQAEVWIAKTTSPKPTWIARNGDRYGLRTALADIENIHSLHRPEIRHISTTCKFNNTV